MHKLFNNAFKIKKVLYGFCFVSIALLLSGCSNTSFFKFGTACVLPISKKEIDSKGSSYGPGSDVWAHQDSGLSVRIVAPPTLNQVQNFAHGTTVGIYQLSSPDKFVREITTQTGVKRLLMLSELDDTILQYDTRAIQPRSSTRFDLSRVEKSRYVAILVGYSNLITERSARLIQIPLVRRSRSSLNPVNWFTSAPKPFPAKLDIAVYLGNNQIDRIAINVMEECS